MLRKEPLFCLLNPCCRSIPRERSCPSMKRSAALLVFILIVCSMLGVSQNNAPDSTKAILDRLDSLTRRPESEWRFHTDIPHPEDPGLNDSDWGVFTVKNISGPGGEHANEEHWTETRVFRRWVQVPEKINGYATQGSRVWLDLRFGSPDHLMITVFSNGAVLYRGDDDNILPVLLTENSQPGQKYLVTVWVVAGDIVQSEFFHSELIIDPPKSRPDPARLRLQILGSRPIIAAYEDGKAERERQLQDAL